MSFQLKVPRVFGVGVDIQQVARLQSFFQGNQYKRETFLNRVFHPLEVEEFKKRENVETGLQYLASRWALKEALVKASGETRLVFPGIFLEKPPKPATLEPGQQRKLKPKLRICGDKNEELLFGNLGIWADGMHASISHEKDFAVASVVLEYLVDLDQFNN